MDLNDVTKEYPAVQVYSTNGAIGHGSRVVYWVGGDGSRCIVFNCVGERFTVHADELEPVNVINVAAHSFEGGRLRYKQSAGSPWIDAGPLNVTGRTASDPPLSTIKRNIGKAPTFDELIEDEEDDTSWESDGW